MKLLVCLIGMVSIASCIDPINLTLEDDEEFLVIDGSLTTAFSQHQLKIYYSTGQRVEARRPVENAIIELITEDGDNLLYEEIQSGVYQLINPFAGETGKTYHVEITLANGRIYESEPEQMPLVISGEKIFFEYVLKPEVNEFGFSFNRPYIDVFVATELPTDSASFWIKWDIETIYGYPEIQCSPLGPPPEICYVTKPPKAQTINLLNGTTIQADYLPRYFLADLQLPGLDAEFRNKHYFLVNQKSLTAEAYEYWRKIRSITNQTGSVFDAPPAFVRGNVSNRDNPEETVLGYFEVASVDSLRAAVTQSDFRELYLFPENVCRPGNPINLFERACCTCELLPNSTFERPVWW